MEGSIGFVTTSLTNGYIMFKSNLYNFFLNSKIHLDKSWGINP